MPSKLPDAFELKGLKIELDRILPMKRVIADPKKNSAFKRIMTSMRQMGLIIEPLIVYRSSTGRNTSFSLLDGHLRLEAAKQLGWDKVPCLVSTEDEAYTYNHKVNVVPPIQQHFMIIKAIEHGVSEERIAAALDVDVVSIRQKRDLLDGVCPEAVELLKTKPASRETLRELRKVRPMRQIEMAELMLASHNFTSGYAKCLIATTSEDQLVNPQSAKALRSVRPDEIARLEREMEGLEQDFKAIEESHGKNVLSLVLAIGYLRKLLENASVARFLTLRHSDIRAEFSKLIENASLERSA